MAEFDRETYEKLKRLRELEAKFQPVGAAPSAPSVDTSPFKAKPRIVYNSGTQDVTYGDPDEIAAAAAGVDIDSGAPKGISTGYESFATDDATFNDFIQKQLYQEVGPSAQLRMGPVSGKREYFDPTTKRWTLLSHSQPGQKALALADDVLGIVGGMAGMIGPAKAKVLPELLAGAGKTAVGSTATDWIRQQIGNKLGVNEGVPQSEQLWNASDKGAIEGGLDFAGAGAFNVGRYMKNRVLGRSRVFTDEEAQQMLAGIDKYRGVVDEVNKMSDQPFTPFLHQLLDPNSPIAEIAESKFGTLLASPEEAVRMKVAEIRSNQYGALRSAFANANAPMDRGIPQGQAGNEMAGNPLASGIQQEMQAGTQMSQQQVAQQQAMGSQMVQALPQGVVPTQIDAAQAARESVWGQATRSASEVDEAYKQFHDRIAYSAERGESPYAVEIKDPDLLKVINEMGRNTITKAVKGKGIVDSGARPDPLTNTPGRSARVDLMTLDAARKRLKELSRDKTQAGNNVTYGTYDLRGAEKALDREMSNYLKKGSMDGTLPADTYEKWIGAKSAAIEDARKFKTAFMENFLKKDESGEWTVNDQKSLASIFHSKDLEAAGQLKDMIAHDPVAMRETKKALFALYEHGATKNGLPSRQLHDAFMSEYGPIMDTFFAKGDAEKLKSMRDVADSLAQSIVDAKSIERRLRTDLGGIVTRWSPDEIVRNSLTARVTPEKARKIMEIASRHEGATEALRNGMMNEIQSKVFPTGVAGTMDLKGLGKLLRDRGANIVTIMGPQYYNQLQHLAKAGPLMNRARSQIGEVPMNTALRAAVRIPAGQMSAEGRMLTFLNVLGKQNMPEQIFEALTSPKELERLANYTRIAVQRTRAAGTGTAVVGTLVGQEAFDDE